MCMPLPDGYGSISSWYQWRSSPPPSDGFGVWNVRSSCQTRCHFSSIVFGSYLSIGNKKASHMRGLGEARAAAPRGLPELVKELLPHHFATRHSAERVAT